MNHISFQERVKQDAIKYSKLYDTNFVNDDYLVCSSAFIQKDDSMISAKKDNYPHLLGVNSSTAI